MQFFQVGGTPFFKKTPSSFSFLKLPLKIFSREWALLLPKIVLLWLVSLPQALR